MKTVDVIIPTYKPNKRFMELVQRLNHQTYPIHKIIIMNTEEKYYNQLVYGTKFLDGQNNILIRHLSKKEFDHGRTRNKGISYSNADYFVCMTQDALPEKDNLIESLVKAVEQENVAIAYGRQLPEKDCDFVEAYTRTFNYPEQSYVKGIKDLPTLGIKTYFCSNVCAIYRRDIFCKLGGFIKRTIFNEDMIFAAKAIKAGYQVAYAADARVVHSHNYNCMEQFHRNFDLGVSQADNPEVFANVPSENEGIRMIKSTITYLREQRKASKIPMLLIKSAYKYAGFKLGTNYQKLPHSFIDKCSMNKEYWKQYGLKKDATNIDATKGYGRSELELRK